MRIVLAAVLVTATTGLATAADPKPPDKDAPTDAAIIDMCGGRLAKAFHQFGTPVDLLISRGDKPDDDSVFLDYGPFGLEVRNKTVIGCYFYQEWKDTVKGVKIGDSREQVVKVLGNAPVTIKSKVGLESFKYDLKDNDAEMYVDFDKDNKVRKVEIQAK